MQNPPFDELAAKNPGVRRGRPAGALGRTHKKKLSDQMRVGRLYLHGYAIDEIASLTGLGERMVQSEITARRKGWTQRAQLDVQTATFQQLDRIDAIERDAHDGWMRSLGQVNVETKQATSASGGNVNRATVRNAGNRDGNPVFLARMAWCVEQRCKLLGLEKPVAVEVRGTFVEIAMGIDWNLLGIRAGARRGVIDGGLPGTDDGSEDGDDDPDRPA
ncbi:MAG: hypothetical protein NTX54_09715 [Chloroflexi bacterium]|nr:hypothetical protein [Chloroflexota bacterium]